LRIDCNVLTNILHPLAEVAVWFMKVKSFDLLWRYTWLTTAWLSISGVADLLVTVSIFYSFYTNKTAFADDDGWMTRILMYGLHSGAFVTVTTVITLVFVTAWKHNLVYAGMTYILGKIYSNTLLYVLNRRPVSDPRYSSRGTGTTSSSNRGKSGQNTSNFMPTFAPNRGKNTSSSARVPPKDPYGSQMDGDLFETTKPPSLTEGHDDEVLAIHTDKRSETSYMPQETERSSTGNEPVPYQ